MIILKYLSLIELNLFSIFYETVNYGSFSKTAERLGKTQSSVSQSIKLLEEQLEVQLFKRTNTGIVLTNEGKALYYYVEKSLSALNSGAKVLSEFKAQQITTITVGILSHLSTYSFVKIIKDFNKKYPTIKINLVDKDSNELLSMLEKKEIDIMVDTDLVETDDRNIEIKKIKDLIGGFVGNANYKELASKELVTAKEISLYPTILPGKTTSTRKLIDSSLRRKNVSLNPVVTTNTTMLAQNLIDNSIGIGWILYECVRKELEDEIFYKINVDIDEVKIPLSIAYQKQNINDTILELVEDIKKGM